MTKRLPPLRKQKLIKKSQEKDDKIKWKLHTANMNWNGWKSQLHWNNIEWANTIIKIKRKTIFNFFKKTILIKITEQLIGLVIKY